MILKQLFYFVVFNMVLSFVEFGQQCKKAGLNDFPASDLPKFFDSVGIKKHPSYKYYYGVGVSIDYLKARTLAFIEMKFAGENNDEPVAGPSVLLMIYANGYGVKKNIPLCIRLACANVNGAPAEVDGRIAHLRQMESGVDKKVFDICDDITSGYMQGYCESVNSEKETKKRTVILERVVRKWSAKDQSAYKLLHKSASGFFQQRTYWEIDMSGTARAALAIGESENLEEDFKQDTTGR